MEAVSVAGEGGAVARIVGGVVQRFDRREAGDEDQCGAKQAAAEGQYKALRKREGDGY